MPPAAVSVRLRTESEVPLAPRHIAQLDDGALLLADPHLPRVWRIGTSDSTPPRVVVTLDPSGAVRIAGLVRGPAAVGVLTSNGDVALLDARTFDVLGIVRGKEEQRTIPLALRAMADTSWIVLAREFGGAAGSATRGTVFLTLTRLRPPAAPQEIWRTEWFRMSALDQTAFDVIGIGGSADTLLLSGTLPPRVRKLARGGAATADARLDGSPKRRVTRAARRKFAASVRTLPPAYRSRLELPDVYPAVLAAHFGGGGILAIAEGPDDRRYLDLYCGNRYHATLLSDRRIEEIWVLDHDIAVLLDRAEEGFYELQLHPLRSLPVSCS